jgi:hypothetical protein
VICDLRVAAKAALCVMVSLVPAMINDASAQVTTVVGVERLRWEQAAAPDRPAEGLRFLVYVNGEPRDLPYASCGSAVNGVYSCAAPLPILIAGTYILELAAVVDGMESPRTQPIHILVPQVVSDAAFGLDTLRASSTTPAAIGATPVCVAGRCLAPTVLTTSNTPITSPVATGDGRLLFIENHRHVRVIADRAMQPQPAISATGDGRLLAVALAPNFPDSREAYVAAVQTAASGARSVSVTRVREVNNRFAQAALIVPDLPLPAEGDPSMAVDASGYIYLAMPVWAGGSTDPYSGALLRYAADGTLPRDAGQASPVVAANAATPVALAAEPGRGRVWLLRAAANRRELWSAAPAAGSIQVRREASWTLGGDTHPATAGEPFAALAQQRQVTPVLFASAEGSLLQATLDGAAAPTPQPVSFPHPVTAVAALPDGDLAVVARLDGAAFSLLTLTSGR